MAQMIKNMYNRFSSLYVFIPLIPSAENMLLAFLYQFFAMLVNTAISYLSTASF